MENNLKHQFITFEGATLDDVYKKATESFKCSIISLNIDIVQAPSKGFLGFFAKNAIIKVRQLKINSSSKSLSKSEKIENQTKSNQIETLNSKLHELNEKSIKKDTEITKKVVYEVHKDEIFNNFHHKKPEQLHNVEIVNDISENVVDEIKKDINNLFSKLCYKIEPIEVKILEDKKTVYIKFLGEDSALLIGKEGYRYKALSYILFNWINERYSLMLRLEVAEFLKSQEEAIFSYLEPVIETIKVEGFFKTKLLDGILIHIALTKLRDEFPNKYVAVKTTQKGEKYILVNEYRN